MSPRASKYTMTEASQTTCPKCGAHPTLLATDRQNKPAFYICRCGFVGEIGVGPVPTSDPPEEEDS